VDLGGKLREWRVRRRMSQLDLALEAGVSARHLSFVETGRSHPGRDLLMRLAEHLDVPYRERNELLLAAGHAPAFPERSLDDPDLAAVRGALDLILGGHEPFPAIAFDRTFDLVAVNATVAALSTSLELDRRLLEPPINAVRASLHPRGLAPLVANLGAWQAFFRDRLERQYAITGDERLAALAAEVAGYPAPDPEPGSDPTAGGAIGPLRIRPPGGGPELSFVPMFAGFDAPFEVTTSELAIELLFPADATTAAVLEELERHQHGVLHFSK
jgi:transcriptional regulator with XRE-family HTH domain